MSGFAFPKLPVQHKTRIDPVWLDFPPVAPAPIGDLDLGRLIVFKLWSVYDTDLQGHQLDPTKRYLQAFKRHFSFFDGSAPVLREAIDFVFRLLPTTFEVPQDFVSFPFLPIL